MRLPCSPANGRAHPQPSSPCDLEAALLDAREAALVRVRGRSTTSHPSTAQLASPSELGNWPVQIKLAPVQAPYFDGADLLVAADCCAYAYGSFHRDFIRGRKCLVGCPKLDGTDYSAKLAEIIARNDIESVVITRMEVPCCGGLEQMAKRALQLSGKPIPWQVVTFSLDGRIVD